MKNKVFLIILNWNGWQMTLNCLKSVSGVKTEGFDLEVVLVDNGSVDESVDKINELVLNGITDFKKKKIGIKFIQNKENLGFVGGNNVGIDYALKNGADYICLLNNDTRVDPNFIVQLLKASEADAKIGVVGGKIYFEKGYEFCKKRYKKEELGRVIWYAGGLIDWNNVYASHRGVDEVDRGQYEKSVETDFVNGCLMFVKRAVFEKVGFLEPQYYLYLEDTDFSLKAKKAEYKLIFAPQAKIWHLNAGSSSSGSSLQDYFITRNRLLFGLKWAPLRAKMALIKESIKFLLTGRDAQKAGVRDFYLRRFGKGGWK